MTFVGDKFPPRGFIFRQPEIQWQVPQETAMLGLRDAARALQMARAQNVDSGLDPSYEACERAIRDYTCERMKSDPELLAKFCGEIPEELTVETKQRKTRGAKKCASCGR
jgi:hypothetical protein